MPVTRQLKGFGHRWLVQSPSGCFKVRHNFPIWFISSQEVKRETSPWKGLTFLCELIYLHQKYPSTLNIPTKIPNCFSRRTKISLNHQEKTNCHAIVKKIPTEKSNNRYDCEPCLLKPTATQYTVVHKWIFANFLEVLLRNVILSTELCNYSPSH